MPGKSSYRAYEAHSADEQGFHAADVNHDYESERNAPEGGLGPCAVCGASRGAVIHGYTAGRQEIES